MAQDGDRRELGSWKEIGEYLGITDRSAQAWEKQRKLPVYRYPGAGRGKVFAYTDELDKWKMGHAEAQSQNPLRLWKAALPLLLIAGFGVWRFAPSHEPALARVQNDTLIVLDANGNELWRKAFSGHEESPLYVSTAVADLDGDGSPEVLFAHRQYGASYLVCYDRRGRERWRFKPGRQLQSGKDIYSHSFGLHSFHAAPMGRDKKMKVAVTAHHQSFSPAQVALLDAAGRVLREYWHPGHLNYLAVGDLDGNGESELYLAGTNNREGAGTLVVLDPDRFGGSAATAAGNSHFDGIPRSEELARIILPRSNLNRRCCTYNNATKVALTGDGLEVHTNEDPFSLGPPLTIIYELSATLQLRRVVYSDLYVSTLRQLEREGKLQPLETEEAWRLRNAMAFPGRP